AEEQSQGSACGPVLHRLLRVCMEWGAPSLRRRGHLDRLTANDQVQQRGRLGRLGAPESRDAGPVCCNGWFGLETLNVPIRSLLVFVFAPGERENELLDQELIGGPFTHTPDVVNL